MNCTKCSGKTEVIATRDYEYLRLRKRRCVECGYTFFTRESIASDKATEFQYKVADAQSHMRWRRKGNDDGV